MDQYWTQVFSGSIDDRPVIIKVWDDGESHSIRVETNYNKDQIIGDLPDVIGVPVSANEPMNVDGATPEELERILVEDGGFSEAGAKEIARLSRSYSA